MPDLPWDANWHRVDRGPTFTGGQGYSFLAAARDGSGRKAFIKTLRGDRTANWAARGRFRREAVAYETLAGLGPPAMFEHNSEAWEDSKLPLYLALEYIEGPHLGTAIGKNGPVRVDQALRCTRELAETIHGCHGTGITHRDLKPANVVLRGGDVTKPVLVDFGLSFNDRAQDNLTRIGEEIGNRFLRLPEHSWSGRGARSDVTQLAGLFLYMITGVAPRVLLDEAGLMPHRRADACAILEPIDRRPRLRLLRVFDKAFTQEIAARYGSALELMDDLEGAIAMDSDDEGDDLDQLVARIGDITHTRNLPNLEGLRKRLNGLLHSLDATVVTFAESQGLLRYQDGWDVEVTTDDQWAAVRLSIAARQEAPNHVNFRVEPRGLGEFGLLVDGEDAWRGDDPDQAFTDAVKHAVAKSYLAAQQGY